MTSTAKLTCLYIGRWLGRQTMKKHSPQAYMSSKLWSNCTELCKAVCQVCINNLTHLDSTCHDTPPLHYFLHAGTHPLLSSSLSLFTQSISCVFPRPALWWYSDLKTGRVCNFLLSLRREGGWGNTLPFSLPPLATGILATANQVTTHRPLYDTWVNASEYVR